MNPLYTSMYGTKQSQNPFQTQQTNNNTSQDWNALMGQLQANPMEMVRNAGYDVPDELNGNPQAMVQHLIRTGQVGGQMMQRIAPMLQRMGFR